MAVAVTFALARVSMRRAMRTTRGFRDGESQGYDDCRLRALQEYQGEKRSENIK
jgi:hypothetical protein